MKYRFDNMDASENVFFSRQLEAIRATAFDVQYPQLKGFTLVPMKTDLHIGAEQYTYRFFDKVGKAVLSSDMSDRGPRIDIKGSEATQRIRSLKDSYGYSLQESRNAQMAGLDLDGRKAKAARDAIAVAMDDIILLGSASSVESATAAGLQGLFTITGAQTFTPSTGSGGTTLWTAKTPDEIVQDMLGLVFQIYQNTNMVEVPDTLVLPLARKGLVSSTRMGDGSNQTILSHFLEVNGMVKTVEFSQKLNSNAAWTGCRACAYTNSSDKLEALTPVEFEQMAPQFDGYEVITHCHARTGGTVAYFPASIGYMDNI